MYSRRTLRPITVIRAVQVVSVVVTSWSSAMPWGDETGIGKGPPAQYERHLVGAALLLGIAAVAMFATARKSDKPGRAALAVSGLACAGAIALALVVRSAAIDAQIPHVLVGGGWMWMAAGASMSLGAVASALALRLTKPAPANAESASKASPNKPRSAPRKKSSGKKKRKKR